MYADIEVSEIVVMRNSTNTRDTMICPSASQSFTEQGCFHVRLCHQPFRFFYDSLWQRHLGSKEGPPQAGSGGYAFVFGGSTWGGQVEGECLSSYAAPALGFVWSGMLRSGSARTIGTCKWQPR